MRFHLWFLKLIAPLHRSLLIYFVISIGFDIIAFVYFMVSVRCDVIAVAYFVISVGFDIIAFVYFVVSVRCDVVAVVYFVIIILFEFWSLSISLFSICHFSGKSQVDC